MSRTPSACPRRKVVPARGVSQRLELNLPPADIEAIRTVAALTGETTLTTSDLLHDRQTMAALGVACYLTKSSNFAALAQLGQTIKDVLVQTKGGENNDNHHTDPDDH
jgi:hypothetical protein